MAEFVLVPGQGHRLVFDEIKWHYVQDQFFECNEYVTFAIDHPDEYRIMHERTVNGTGGGYMVNKRSHRGGCGFAEPD